MKICVVGGGASGMVAAVAALRNGAETTLIEANEKLGKKIYITGKGRCNMTNLCPPQIFLGSVVTNSKFLYGAVNAFPPEKTVKFFNELGLKTKTERGNRVFPISDKASDVTKALERELKHLGCDIRLNEKVFSLGLENGKIKRLDTASGKILCDRAILACGGASYPATGSDGSGFSLAKSVGHTVTALRPSLVGIETEENYDLAGLSLVNVNVSVLDKNGKKLFSEFGEILFTHDGVSGPVILTASAYLNKTDLAGCKIALDLKPALTSAQLDARVLRDFTENSNKEFKNSLGRLLPERLISTIIERTGVNPEKKVNAVTASERAALIRQLKNFTLTAVRFGDLSQAVVTSGGVNVKEIDPKTMRSKLIENLYFCGEMLDVDALTGGFNLQIAFSTGYAAGNAASSAV